MQPSDFCTYPWSCVFMNAEREIVALNIMKILRRTGDQWREISWDEYLSERQKDGGGNTGNMRHTEKECFADVQPYTISAQSARLFSPTWADVFSGTKTEKA